MDNMKIWNAVKQPPPEALKPIMAGRLKGKSDINPIWRFKAMTEQFGVCGIGWKYDIVRLWNEPAAEEQIFAFASVNVYIKLDDKWSDPIPGTGGSMLIEQENDKVTGGKRLYSNDEAYKMAVTDAFGVAVKPLGVAADVYAGLWDGSKYREKPEQKGVETGTTQEHYCTKHNVKFFKTEKMKSWAHLIAGTKDWCNEQAQPVDVMKSLRDVMAAHHLTAEDVHGILGVQSLPEWTKDHTLAMAVTAIECAMKKEEAK